MLFNTCISVLVIRNYHFICRSCSWCSFTGVLIRP